MRTANEIVVEIGKRLTNFGKIKSFPDGSFKMWIAGSVAELTSLLKFIRNGK